LFQKSFDGAWDSSRWNYALNMKMMLQDQPMNQIEREEEIFHAALAIPSPDERVAYLNAACAGDAQLRQRVEALLTHNQVSTGLLDEPPPGLNTIFLPTSVSE
jgi:hypothetical protein